MSIKVKTILTNDFHGFVVRREQLLGDAYKLVTIASPVRVWPNVRWFYTSAKILSFAFLLYVNQICIHFIRRAPYYR
jgi:hypothetical protein